MESYENITSTRQQERPGVNACEQIPLVYVMWGVIFNFYQLSPTDLQYLEGLRVQQEFVRLLANIPSLRAMHSIHKCVAKNAPHLFH